MDWPALWTALLIIPLALLWAGCLADVIFRSRSSGWVKAAWAVGILVLPVVGALIYLIVRTPPPDQDLATATLTRGWAGPLPQPPAVDAEPPSLSTELTRLTDMRVNGHLSPDDFTTAKARLLASGPA
jgi:hypothetical protein